MQFLGDRPNDTSLAEENLRLAYDDGHRVVPKHQLKLSNN